MKTRPMKTRRDLKLVQTRGSWFAKADNIAARAALGEEPIPVLRDWENGMFDWTQQLPTYHEQAEVQVEWWSNPAHLAWLETLVEGAAVWVRQAVADASGGGSSMVGRSKGVWRLGPVEHGDQRLRLTLAERIGDTRG